MDVFQPIPKPPFRKSISKMRLLIIFFCLSLGLQAQSTEPVWLTNLEEAQSLAKKEGKLILLNFSGSDWCNNCKRLHRSLFEEEEFKTYASQNLILLNLDFPAKKKNQLSKDQKEYNDKLAEKYNKKGIFPLVLLLDSTGKTIGNLEYPQKDVQTYLLELKKLNE